MKTYLLPQRRKQRWPGSRKFFRCCLIQQILKYQRRVRYEHPVDVCNSLFDTNADTRCLPPRACQFERNAASNDFSATPCNHRTSVLTCTVRNYGALRNAGRSPITWLPDWCRKTPHGWANRPILTRPNRSNYWRDGLILYLFASHGSSVLFPAAHQRESFLNCASLATTASGSSFGNKSLTTFL